MFVMPRACPECGAAGGEPHVQPCQHAKHELSRHYWSTVVEGVVQ
jgi:hypothetical protein